MPVEIIEIIRRSEQGVTEPFICRGADDEIYFVKGASAGRSSLIKEWVCGRLAQLLGLPIAPFEIVDVAPELIDHSSSMNLRDLGSGLAFGSRSCGSCNEILFSQIREVPDQRRAATAAFDRWIRNYDRTLSEHGGNPNLLWSAAGKGAIMIDHNNAFDVGVTGQAFADFHVFGADFLATSCDASAKRAFCEGFDAVLLHWQEIVSSVPQSWHFEDARETVATNFDFAVAREVLCAHREPGFWAW